MRFRKFLEDVTWQQVMDHVPANLTQQLENIPEDLLQQIVMAISQDADASGQKIEDLWGYYINAKSPADIFKIRASLYQMGRQNRAARTLSPEDQQKDQIYNSIYQKLESIFQTQPQAQLPNYLLRLLSLNKDFKTTLIAPSFWQLKQNKETVKPFYMDRNIVRVAPDFPYNKYRDWINILASAIRQTPLNQLKATIQTLS